MITAAVDGGGGGGGGDGGGIGIAPSPPLLTTTRVSFPVEGSVSDISDADKVRPGLYQALRSVTASLALPVGAHRSGHACRAHCIRQSIPACFFLLMLLASRRVQAAISTALAAAAQVVPEYVDVAATPLSFAQNAGDKYYASAFATMSSDGFSVLVSQVRQRRQLLLTFTSACL